MKFSITAHSKSATDRVIAYDKTKYYYLNNSTGETSVAGDNFFPYIDPGPNQNIRIAVFGASGSGKSTWIGLALDEILHNKLPGVKQIYIISDVGHDPVFDDQRRRIPLKRLNCRSEAIVQVQAEMLKDSLIIFDDIERISHKQIRTHILNLRANCLENGRHYNQKAIFCVSHNALGGAINSALKSEMNALVVFPAFLQYHQLKTILSKYVGLSNEQINFVKNLDSRWAYINIHPVPYCIFQQGIKLFT